MASWTGVHLRGSSAHLWQGIHALSFAHRERSGHASTEKPDPLELICPELKQPSRQAKTECTIHRTTDRINRRSSIRQSSNKELDEPSACRSKSSQCTYKQLSLCLHISVERGPPRRQSSSSHTPSVHLDWSSEKTRKKAMKASASFRPSAARLCNICSDKR